MRAAVYDPAEDVLFIGGDRGHSKAVSMGNGDPSFNGMSGWTLVDHHGTIYLMKFSGTYPGPTPEAAIPRIRSTLGSLFGQEVVVGTPPR